MANTQIGSSIEGKKIQQMYFFQLCAVDFPNLTYCIMLQNLRKFRLSITNGLEMASFRIGSSVEGQKYF